MKDSNKTITGSLDNNDNTQENQTLSDALHEALNSIRFASIPGGSFMMGEDDTLHRVSVASFELMTTPVTVAQYRAFCQNTGWEIPDNEGWRGDHCPVINVSYWQCARFCRWLSAATGRHCRLPTEAEWEYACRAGTETRYHYGDTPDHTRMHCSKQLCEGKRKRTVNVGRFPANDWGLFDMHGNVKVGRFAATF